VRELWIDEGLPAGLAEELAARGRRARSVTGTVPDTELSRDDVILVTTLPLEGAAVITARDAAGRRDAVHRYAHAIAAQRPGATRRYPR
jgi:hypothetical protein